MSSPNFAMSASVAAKNDTINLGPGSGSLTVGGKPLDPSDETTLDGYTGTINVSANGDGTDSVALKGNASNVIQVTASPPSVGTDQNKPVSFTPNVVTSFADTYNLTATAPPGWTVSIDASGKVTATPAPGLQSGTYPIQIVAQSATNPNLVAQTSVGVTITPTRPGLNFKVPPDPLFTVPFNSAQLPTAFRATMQNLGPQADTYNLTFSNIPSGFTVLKQRHQRHGAGRADRDSGTLSTAQHRPAAPAAGDANLVHRHGHQHNRPIDHEDPDGLVHDARNPCRVARQRNADSERRPWFRMELHRRSSKRRQCDGDDSPDRLDSDGNGLARRVLLAVVA
jgi:hypothetical protein